ncbi:MmcQ/YjbR family DNA-binding protein [Pseudactinotalea sp.]|uniref:MmcQ/YjbR family DNA-binding protein n=1 Tax=Pseudactinotalea sp. TaxID=1926260 RepID=UPI003B3B9F6E
MADWDDVERAALALPEVEEGTTWGNRCWKVRGKTFAWVRPLGKKDRADLGEDAPEGEILAVRVDDLGEKDAILATPGPWFTIPHFERFAAVLVRLDEADAAQVEELVLDAWRAMAPSTLLAEGGHRTRFDE